MIAISSIHYCCPRCKGDLTTQASAYYCVACDAAYPVIAGIPDFRVYDDPYISIEADREKGLHLYEFGKDKTFAELVTYYYSITPEVPDDDAQRYTAHHLGGIVRGDGILNRMRAYNIPIKEQDTVLDVGCGTSGFVATATAHARMAIGVDIAFRWLIIGRKRLQELGYDTSKYELVCACADYLPFADNIANKVVMESTLEHVRDAKSVLHELRRVTEPSGRLMGRTVNRYSIAPEPHVGVWGVGFLPRQWMNGYVQRVKNIPYEHIHLHSYGELQHLLSEGGWQSAEVRKPHLTLQDYEHHSSLRRQLFMLYQQATAIVPPLMRLGPFLDFVS